MIGYEQSSEGFDWQEIKNMIGVNVKEMVKKIDFILFLVSEMVFFDELLEKLIKEMSLCLKCKKKKFKKGSVYLG